MNVALVDPAGMVTVGLAAWACSEFELVRVTTAPPVGAADARVTVPTLLTSLATDVGLRVKLATLLAGVTVTVADLDVPAYDPVIVIVTGDAVLL